MVARASRAYRSIDAVRCASGVYSRPSRRGGGGEHAVGQLRVERQDGALGVRAERGAGDRALDRAARLVAPPDTTSAKGVTPSPSSMRVAWSSKPRGGSGHRRAAGSGSRARSSSPDARHRARLGRRTPRSPGRRLRRSRRRRSWRGRTRRRPPPPGRPRRAKSRSAAPTRVTSAPSDRMALSGPLPITTTSAAVGRVSPGAYSTTSVAMSAASARRTGCDVAAVPRDAHLPRVHVQDGQPVGGHAVFSMSGWPRALRAIIMIS